MKITFPQAQKNVSEIANRKEYTKDFLFELMAAYGRSISAITKLRNGLNNLADDKENDILQRGVVYFRHTSNDNVLSMADDLSNDPLTVRYNPRYIIVTDYKQLAAKDTKKGTTLDIKIQDIDRHVDFFYGWTGDEIQSEKTEAVADRRAADKMKDLYAEIEIVNREKMAIPGNTFKHDLNVFFSRLLFCFFAEDTKVFSRDTPTMFTNAIKDYTQTDGSDLNQFLDTLFNALDSEEKTDFTSPFSTFPYVNGTLFDTKKHNIAIPKFNAQARKLILDCGNLNWAEINPDIFGSMFQSIVDEQHRANHGMHYTSVPNIMKTIEPLFLDELREEFDKNFDNIPKLFKLWDRLSKVKVFDPACGSGNFLIIAYKKLREIEHGIIERIIEEKGIQNLKLSSLISLNNFYGIEIDDFAHEVAILSLYIAKHQMNIEFEKQFGKEIKLIPLKDNANIVHGNSMKLDWQKVCPNIAHSLYKLKAEQQTLIDISNSQEQLIGDDDLNQKIWDEIYLIGNPPYLGSSLQDKDQKRDMSLVLKDFHNYKNLDLIAAWFKLGADYINGTKAQLAFVSTNSICQGEQVALLWPYIFNKEVEIGFAYTSFKWTNGARNVAGVTVVVINLRPKNKSAKFIYDNSIRAEVSSISAYLTAGSDSIFFERRAKSISGLPDCVMGSKPTDGGFLIFNQEERDKLVDEYPQAIRFIKGYTGSGDYINGKIRYCLWIDDAEADEAKNVPPISKKLDQVAEFRAGRKDTPSTVEYSKYPHRFRQRAHKNSQAIIIPSVSSERREYIPIGFLDGNTVASNAANMVYDAPIWLFGLITSRMHMSWVRAVAGKLKTDYRYSSAIVYANFPVPLLLEHHKQEIASKSRSILFVRENHSEKTLAEMYDPDKMPEDLREAHYELDLVVDRLYRTKPYNSDEERLADLFALYEQMTKQEKKQ